MHHRVISWRSLKPLARHSGLLIFQYGGRSPSWICDVRIWTIHEEHLVIFIALQNLVGIDTVVSIICKFLHVVNFA